MRNCGRVILRKKMHYLGQAADVPFSGHKVLELNFKTATLTFSGLPALDYFGDGSFYLLDTPGVS